MKILVLAPHADDEMLGVGGTIARAIDKGHDVTVAVLTGHGETPHPLWPRKSWNLIREECTAACSILGVSKLIYKELPAACLDYTPVWKINQIVSEVIEEASPEELYIPFLHDLHKDHQAIAYASMVAGRPYLSLGRSIRRVLAYETLSETHLSLPYLQPAFQPNTFVDISLYMDKKLAALNTYKSQLQPSNLPRSLETIKSLAHFRGAHIGVIAAEAFILLRETIL